MKEIEREFPDVHRSLSEVTDNLSEDHTKAVGWIFGRPCYNPGSFQVNYIDNIQIKYVIFSHLT